MSEELTEGTLVSLIDGIARIHGLTDTMQAEIIASLKKRLGRDVTLTCSTDATLLGGAIIRAGDLVIDGSVRGKLDRLGAALNH